MDYLENTKKVSPTTQSAQIFKKPAEPNGWDDWD